MDGFVTHPFWDVQAVGFAGYVTNTLDARKVLGVAAGDDFEEVGCFVIKPASTRSAGAKNWGVGGGGGAGQNGRKVTGTIGKIGAALKVGETWCPLKGRQKDLAATRRVSTHVSKGSPPS